MTAGDWPGREIGNDDMPIEERARRKVVRNAALRLIDALDPQGDPAEQYTYTEALRIARDMLTDELDERT